MAKKKKKSKLYQRILLEGHIFINSLIIANCPSKRLHPVTFVPKLH